MSERPSWMPSGEEMVEVLAARFNDKPDRLRRLIERAVLRGQIEALDTLSAATVGGYVARINSRVQLLRARLSKLEGGHE